jgi:hypothetical protein
MKGKAKMYTDSEPELRDMETIDLSCGTFQFSVS